MKLQIRGEKSIGKSKVKSQKDSQEWWWEGDTEEAWYNFGVHCGLKDNNQARQSVEVDVDSYGKIETKYLNSKEGSTAKY